jgi:hypothetical protein
MKETIYLKENPTLTVASLLSILLASFHIADDVVRGFEPGGFKNASAILILAVWLFGTVALAGRRSGYIIILLGCLLGSVMPLAHMRGVGLVGGRIANSGGKFFFVWTLLALGATSVFSVSLAVRGLWNLRRNKTAQTTTN